MSRTIAPLRSLARISSRSIAPRATISYGRLYSDKAELSVEELNSKVAELEGVKAELEKKATEAEAKAKDMQVGCVSLAYRRKPGVVIRL